MKQQNYLKIMSSKNRAKELCWFLAFDRAQARGMSKDEATYYADQWVSIIDVPPAQVSA